MSHRDRLDDNGERSKRDERLLSMLDEVEEQAYFDLERQRRIRSALEPLEDDYSLVDGAHRDDSDDGPCPEIQRATGTKVAYFEGGAWQMCVPGSPVREALCEAGERAPEFCLISLI